MALRYDKIDAIALDADSVKLLMSLSEGIEQVEPPFAQVGSVELNLKLLENYSEYIFSTRGKGDWEIIIQM